MKRLKKHGTITEYMTHGCRCSACRKAYRLYRYATRISKRFKAMEFAPRIDYLPLIGNASVECRQDWIALYGD